MKIKFVLLSFLLLFARGCDFYSTSLWIFQENGLANEMNPLTRIFNVGWNGLVIVNIILVGFILFMYYYYCFKYQRVRRLDILPDNYREYASQLYFGKPKAFYQIFYKWPKHPKYLMAHTGYVLVRVLIVASFLATIHNLSQFYDFAFYDKFRELVKRPLYVIYTLIALLTFYFYHKVLLKEFRAIQQNG